MSRFAQLDADGLVTGFYADDIHGNAVPQDAVPISDETWQTLLDGQSAGKRMQVGADGTPTLLDPLPPPTDQLEIAARTQRDALLSATDWVITQQEELILTGATPANPERMKAFSTYRQALRDVPQQPGFPTSITWPVAPQ